MAKKISTQLIANGIAKDFDTGAVRSSGLTYSFLSEGSYPSDDKLAKYYTQNVWVHRAIQMRAEALASIPWEVRRKFRNGNERVLPGNESVVRVLMDVNDLMNWNELMVAIESDLCIYGRAFILKIRGETTRDVLALLRLNPTTVTVNTTAAGITSFVQTLGGVPEEFPAEDVLYFHGYSPVDDLGSVSTLGVARSNVEANNYAISTVSSFFQNAAIPAVLLTTEQDIDEDDAKDIKSRWERMFKGVSRWFKTAVLGKGIKAQVLSASPKEWALSEIDHDARITIAAVFGVPATILGASESANYATANVERKVFFENTVVPRARYIASILNSELLSEFGPDLEFVWLLDNVPALQENEDARVDRLVKLVEKGIITAATAAQELGYEVTEAPTPVIAEPKPEDTDFIQADIKRWFTKAKKRLVAGKSPTCDFVSDVIPPSLSESIKAQLEGVTTVAELVSVFDNVRTTASQWRNYP